MGRTPLLDNKAIKDYTYDEKKEYFRLYYHKNITDADKNAVKRVINKDINLELLVKEVGFNKLFDIYIKQLSNK